MSLALLKKRVMMTGISKPFPRPDQGSWLETIALFEAIREGNQPAAMRLLNTSAAREAVLGGGLLGLIELYFHHEEGDKVDGFLTAAHAAGPPPAFGCKPFLP
ncbi:hypothetical protein MFL68_005360 [Corynebacterium sp. BWA136]|nr:hypothetical protein [Corynebacterium sp. BWA136]